MHISSLPSAYSIGNFGKGAKDFIDFLKACKFSYWQVLPFCMADDCNSPYCSYGAFSLNPYFIDPEILWQKGLITEAELLAERQQTPFVCEYSRLFHKRYELLKKAAGRVENWEEIEHFIKMHPYTAEFCDFMGKKSANHNLPWYEWQTETQDESTVSMWQFIQFEAFNQWQEIRRYATENGIKIIGDIPIYVAQDSCDVWKHPEYFALGEDNRPALVAGVPPDYFTEDGQLWGNPVYNWEKMRQDDYRWWCDRLSFMFSLFDGVRIDHFRAFESYWAVAGNAKTAREGRWQAGPGLELLEKFKNIAGERLIIAEDLGEITPAVRKLVEDSGFPGMNVFQFGFFGDVNSNHLPHNFRKNSVSYSGTHDNNTLLGYLWELDDATRKYMLSYCGYDHPDWEKGYDNMLKAIFAGHSDWVILPIQDVLGYGSDTRLNIPGNAAGNWQFRVTREQLEAADKEKFVRLNTLYGRC